MLIKSNDIDSETALMDAVNRLADAGGSLIQVRTREPIRAALCLRKHLLHSDAPYREWDMVNGWRVFTTENFTDHRGVTGDEKDFVAALKEPLDQLRSASSLLTAQSEKVHYFVYMNPQSFLENNPYVLELLQQYAAILPTSNVCMILITTEAPLSQVPIGTVLIADLQTPGAKELEACLRRTVASAARQADTGGSSLDDDDFARIANLGLGLSLYEFETYTAIAIIEGTLAKDESINAERLMEGIGKGKTSIIRQSEILELTNVADIGDVGGMHKYKDWIAKRSQCFSDEAREYGVTPPKGVMLCGVPGTGKSLVAKATASALQVPLVRLDFGRVFSKYIGDSEHRVRSALKMVESMAPVVLFVDEVDKGLGGAGSGGGDSGVSSRVLGSFLTWMQECTASVFTIITANRVDGLPPELLRKGRLDQIFSVGLPSPDERREVLEIHLRKRGRDIDAYKATELSEFLNVSEGYVPAEIEAAVKDALITAFHEGSKTLKMAFIVGALKDMVPMSKSNKDQIDRILAWAENNAVPVSGPVAGKSSAATAPAVRVMRVRRGV
jgi:AAA+ superfamily predicted ATPase